MIQYFILFYPNVAGLEQLTASMEGGRTNKKLQGLRAQPYQLASVTPFYHLTGENARSKVRYTWALSGFLLIG